MAAAYDEKMFEELNFSEAPKIVVPPPGEKASENTWPIVSRSSART